MAAKLSADIVRKLAIDYPECANGLLRTCKDYNRWVTDDNHTYASLKDIHITKWNDKLQKLLLQFLSPDLRHIYTNTTNNHHNAPALPVYNSNFKSYLEDLKVSTKGQNGGGGLYIGGGGKTLYIKLNWNINQTECIDYLSFDDFYTLFENQYQRGLFKKIGKLKNKFMKTVTVLEEIDQSTDEMMGILTNLEHVLSKGRDYWFKKNDENKDNNVLSIKASNKSSLHDYARMIISIAVGALIMGKLLNDTRKAARLGLIIVASIFIYGYLDYFRII